MQAMTMEPILHSYAYALDFLRELVADVPAAQMVAQPDDISNHPAWVIGHLTFSCQLLSAVAGVRPWLPADWGKRYAPGSMPVADASRYEPKEKLLTILGDAQSRITRAVEQLSDAE